MTDMKTYIGKVAGGHSLSIDEARHAFDIMMSGEATPTQIGGFLIGLRMRGESVDEITGAVSTMRAKMLPVAAPEGAVDIVGTGGTGLHTYNISTCTSIVLAACGVHVAKHGNRALSSKSGAADALAALGVDIEIGPERIARCISQAGVGFMFAPSHHAAMKYVGPSRVELATRTIFNILGPLSNPAGVKRQIIGVYDRAWLEPLAHVLKALGSEFVWLVHGADGMDELTTTGVTYVTRLQNGEISSFEITPEDAGLPRAELADLQGGEAEENAAALTTVLEGAKNPYRDIVLLNSAAGLIVAGKVDNLAQGAQIAAQAIDSGKAKQRLATLVEISNS